jgi:putative glycosyltransferase
MFSFLTPKHYIFLQAGLGNQLYMLAYANYLKEEGYTNIKMISLPQKNNQGDTKDRKKRSLLTELPKMLGIKFQYLPHRYVYSFLLRLPKLPLYKILWSKIVKLDLEPAKEWAVFHPIAAEALFNIHIGYYQTCQYISEKFKQQVRDAIINMVPNNTTYTINKNDVAVHIRRGDFFTNGNENIYSRIEVPYYLKALALLSNKIKIEKVYIFSDDFKTIGEDINKICELYNIELVKEQSVLEDFAMLQKFSNFAIGNSTFAWWGAMLAKSTNVIVPKTPWKIEMKDMTPYPENWILIENKKNTFNDESKLLSFSFNSLL